MLLWIAASLVFAALWAPWLYGWGKGLAAEVAEQELAGFWEWLGAACGRAKFGRFYNRALMICALLLLPLLLVWVRRLGAAAGLRREPLLGMTLREPWRRAAGHWALGLAVAGGLLALLGWGLESAGVFSVKPVSPGAGKILTKAALPALAASLGEEFIFRGVLLGLWLRTARPLTAGVGTALVFAALHFLEPPAGYAVADPTAPLAGFQLLGAVLMHYTDPAFFVADFLTLFVLGLVLAWGRVRTGSLWLPMGLHCGWVLVFKLFHMRMTRAPHGWVGEFLAGNDLRSGVLPLAVALLTLLVCRSSLKGAGRMKNPLA